MTGSLPNASRPSVPTESVAASADHPWGPGGSKIKEAVRNLTRAERAAVGKGYICDQRMSTVRNLRHKGMFYLRITSPNGQCGSMELTPLGVNARALILAKATTAAQSSLGGYDGEAGMQTK